MPSQVWTKTSSGNVADTDGTNVGTGDGAGTITITAANVFVRGGFSLTITEGVTVKFTSASGRILVQRNVGGEQLNIQGTEAEPVLFTSDDVTKDGGQYNGIELLNAVSASNPPSVNADWLIMEAATTCIFSLSSTQEVTVNCNNCVFRTMSQSTWQTSGLPTGTWTFFECVLDLCPTDHSAGNANSHVLCSGSGTGPTFDIDHCTINANYNESTNDMELLTAGPRGTIIIRNSILTGDNIHATRVLNAADIVAPGGVLTADWNWVFVDGSAAEEYVDGPNDEHIDPEYFNDSCASGTAAKDLRPNFDTGVMTADEFGGRIGALDAYNIPEPEPEPPAEEESCEADYQNFTDPSCVPVVCDYNFFTGEYPADWREALYERKNTPPHVLTVCITIPNKGISPDFVFAPGIPIELIDITDETVTVNIGPWVQSMRPIKAERDVTFREYQGSDLDLVFMDWFGRLDPHVEGSLFHNLRWRGLRVDIGSWICGTEQVLKHGRYFLQDITRRSEVTVIRLRDWFLETLEQPLRANHSGYLTAKLKNNTGSIIPEFFNIDESIAVVEKVKLVFIDVGREDSDIFEYIGDVTGFQGRGTAGSAFTTADGGVTIPFTAWTPPILLGGPVFAPGDELGFTLSNLNSGNPVEMIYAYLTQHGNLVEGVDIDQAEFFEAESKLPTRAQIKLRFGAPVTLLEACRIAARHGFLTLSTNGEGRVVLGGFKPSLALDLVAIQDVAICSSNDLIDCETANLEILNLIRTSYDPRESDEITHSGLVGGTPNRWLTYPTEDLGEDFNRSAIFYGTEDNPAYFPFDLALPGFRAGQEGAVIAVLQNYWIFFEGTPTAREQLTISTKLHNLNRDLENIVRVESNRPSREVWAQVIGYSKAPLSHNIELTVIDVSDIVQPEFSCGYAFCDSNHFTDDCWVVW